MDEREKYFNSLIEQGLEIDEIKRLIKEWDAEQKQIESKARKSKKDSYTIVDTPASVFSGRMDGVIGDILEGEDVQLYDKVTDPDQTEHDKWVNQEWAKDKLDQDVKIAETEAEL